MDGAIRAEKGPAGTIRIEFRMGDRHVSMDMAPRTAAELVYQVTTAMAGTHEDTLIELSRWIRGDQPE